MSKKKKGNGALQSVGNHNGAKASPLLGGMFSNAGVVQAAVPLASAEILMAKLDAEATPEQRAKVETELRAQLSSFGTHLAKQNADPLDEKAFRTVLDNGAYPGTLKRDDAIAELMKLYMRQQLGTLPAAVARN